MKKNKKLTSDERGEEIINRFYSLNDQVEKKDNSGTDSYISKYTAILCALELVKENIFFMEGPFNENTYRLSYWYRVRTYLENKLNGETQGG